MQSQALCLLGKFGDLVNALPIAWHHHQLGKTVNWVVSQEFASVLLGASYVTIDKGLHRDSEFAMKYAIEKYGDAINLRTWGPHWKGSRARSYNEETYIHAGLGHLFHDLNALPLVFDRRDGDRENFLVARQQIEGKPLILVCVGCGRSSPFNSHYTFLEGIKRTWEAHFRIIDLCKVRCARLYDFLGLYEHASLLIAGEGPALHLASAIPGLPVIALLNNQPFLGTTPRGIPLLAMRYEHVLRRVGEIHKAIAGVAASLKERSASSGEK